MAKDRKSLERSRQAKIMRQKSREKARRGPEEQRGTVDEFQFFRRDLLPPDVSPTTWTRAQILHDLNDHHPGPALAQFLHLMVDPETIRANPDGQAGYMTMAMNLWRIALAPAEMQDQVIDELGAAVAKEEAGVEEFREFARGMVQQHQALYPLLHARVAQRRTERAESDALAAETVGAASAASTSPRRTNDDRFEEYARPLIDAAGEDVAAIGRAYQLATLFSLAAREQLGNRAAALATLRDRLPQEDRAYFDQTAPMMMRRYRELFTGDGAAVAATRATNGGSGADEEEAPPAEPDTVAAAEDGVPSVAETPESRVEPDDPSVEEAPTPESPTEEGTETKRGLLGGLFRRGS